ncbi:MAG: branched-chain amino acid ABC transporter permease [Bacteroidetes bacterium]|nr:branched-chain amino acid ABC transporter permease [Bacteroidota bacterium]
MLIQFLLNGIIIGSVYALLAWGFSIIYSTTKIFHIAYALLFMIAGYFTYFSTSILELPLFLSIGISIFITILISLLIEKTVYLPLFKKNANSNNILVASLGVLIIGINVIALFFGNETKVLNPEISKSISIDNVILTYSQITQVVVCLGILLLLMLLINKTQLGLKIRALKDDQELAIVHGLKVSNTRAILFLLSGFSAAVCGNLIAYDIGFDPYVGMRIFLNAVVVMIIAGNKNLFTVIWSGLLLGMLQALVIWKFSANWQEAITFILLILFLIFRPQGLFGSKLREI